VSRIARVVIPGIPHHITQRGNHRETVFFSDDARTLYLTTLAAQNRLFSCPLDAGHWKISLLQLFFLNA
jgi:REP element-mobilizing transposase RayT